MGVHTTSLERSIDIPVMWGGGGVVGIGFSSFKVLFQSSAEGPIFIFQECRLLGFTDLQSLFADLEFILKSFKPDWLKIDNKCSVYA